MPPGVQASKWPPLPNQNSRIDGVVRFSDKRSDVRLWHVREIDMAVTYMANSLNSDDFPCSYDVLRKFQNSFAADEVSMETVDVPNVAASH
jgi:hypothetical protein